MKKIYWILLFVLWFIFWTILFLIPAKYFPVGSGNFMNIPHFDKYVHSGIFFMFSLFFYQYNKSLVRSAIICLVFTAVYGISIEILQRVVGRGFELMDYVFDFIGVGLFFNMLFLFKLIKNLFVSKQKRLPII